MTAPTALDSPDLLDVLDFTPGEFVALLYEDANGLPRTAIVALADAAAAFAAIPAEVNAYFGVSPVKGPASNAPRRGREEDVTRLSALVADVDIGKDKCPTRDIALAVIAEIGIILGTRASVIVDSGHGLHGYWPISGGQVTDIGATRALLRRFKRLVAHVAANHKANADSVFAVNQMMRLPGSHNCKRLNGEKPILVTAQRDPGGPLTMAEVDERLTEYGIEERDGERDAADGKEVSAPADWKFAKRTCPYVAKMIASWPTDRPKPGGSRNHFVYDRFIRLTAARRLGCISETDYKWAQQALTDLLAELVSTIDPVRRVRKFEIAEFNRHATRKVSSKTDDETGAELGPHSHDSSAGPTPQAAGAPQAGTQQQAPPQAGPQAAPQPPPPQPQPPGAGAMLLEELRAWFARFIVVVDPTDLQLLALWVVHTYLCVELYTTPRLLIDSIAPGSGKTTVLEHLDHLCLNALLAMSMSSAALIPRILDKEQRTILLDEIQRTLVEGRPGVDEVIAVIGSGYRRGASRPVLVPKGRDWVLRNLPTFAPVAMAGNSPNLPPDTVDRSIRILLMPDVDGLAEDSDWEELDTEVKALADRVSKWADSVRADVKNAKGALPAKCVGRLREKWRPLIRVAELADGTGNTWKDTVTAMAKADIEDMEAQREDGLRKQSAPLVLLKDLYLIWPIGKPFMPTDELIRLLIAQNPDYWDAGTSYNGLPRKALNATRFGRMVKQAANAMSSRQGRGGTPRGYARQQFDKAWRTLKISKGTP